MECSRTWQLRASEASVANSTERWLRTGKAPGRPRQVGQMLVFGSAPKRLAQPQKALVSVRSWTWTSSPMTGSYLARMSGGGLIAVLMSLQFSADSKVMLRPAAAPPPPPCFRYRFCNRLIRIGLRDTSALPTRQQRVYYLLHDSKRVIYQYCTDFRAVVRLGCNRLILLWPRETV